MREIAAAPFAVKLTEEEMREAQDAAEFLAWNRGDGQVYRVKWLWRSRLTVHGLTGFATIFNQDGSELKTERARIHLCSNAKCGMKFDPRGEPIMIHGVPVEWPPEALGDPDGNLDAPVAPGEALEAALDGPGHGGQEAPNLAKIENVGQEVIPPPAEVGKDPEVPPLAEVGKDPEVACDDFRSGGELVPDAARVGDPCGHEDIARHEPQAWPDHTGKASPRPCFDRPSSASEGIAAGQEDLETPRPPGDASTSDIEPTSEVASDCEFCGEVGSSLLEDIWRPASAQGDHEAGSSACDVRGVDVEAGCGGAGASLEPGPPESSQIQLGVGDPDCLESYRLPALQLLLQEERLKWERPGYYLPLMAFMVLCSHMEQRLVLIAGDREVDVLAMIAPWLSNGRQRGESGEGDFRSGEDDTLYLMACKVELVGDSEFRQLVWPSEELEFLQLNHYVSCARSDLALQLEPHACCRGVRCGGVGEPCMGPLFEACARSGFLPLPTACNGECAPDVCCFWSGLPRDQGHWTAMRSELSSLLAKAMNNPGWAEIFDHTLQPNWRPLAEKLMNERRPQRPMMQDSLRSSEAGVQKSGMQEDAPSKVDQARPQEDPEAASSICMQESMRQAIRWAACGEEDAEMMDDATVDHIIEKLSQDRRDAWLRQHRQEKGEILRSGEAAPDGDGHKQPESTAVAKKKKPRFRKNRSYLLKESLALAKEYQETHKKMTGQRRKRGTIKRFLKTKPVSQDKVFYDHFLRVLSKVEKTNASALARRRTNTTVPEKKRRRFHGLQGDHSIKAPVLRAELFRWFCSMRGLIKGRLPLHILANKALSLRMACIVSALENSLKPRVPKIMGTNWLLNWRKEYCVSLRRPNKRWKVPRPVLLQRLRIMWLNVIRLRTLALLIFGYDLEVAACPIPPRAHHKNHTAQTAYVQS